MIDRPAALSLVLALLVTGACASEPPPDAYQETSIVSADAVLEAQRALRAAGLYRGPIDGQIGPPMKDALRAYQARRHLPETAILDATTLQDIRARQAGE